MIQSSFYEQKSIENMIHFYNEELQNINNIKDYLTPKERLKLTKRNIIIYNYNKRHYELTPSTKEILKGIYVE